MVVTVGARRIGAGVPSFIAAEAGINHNGDLTTAHAMVDAVADAGADAIKFQTYKTEDFISDASLTYEYQSGGQLVRESQFEMFKRCELAEGALEELRAHADSRGIACFSTPTSKAGIDDVVRAGIKLLKNGSDYLVNLPLIRDMARSNLPTVLSTGMATLGEIRDAVQAFREAGGSQLILLHCTSSYPTAPEDVHLRKMLQLQRTFGLPVGLSDHTDGWLVPTAAVAMGACFIEKHFTLDKQLPGPDHRFSADPEELAQLVKSIRLIERSLGDDTIGPTAAEESARQNYRLSCVAAIDISTGTLIEESHVAFRRPGTGHPPKDANLFLGKRAKKPLRRGEFFGPDMCE